MKLNRYLFFYIILGLGLVTSWTLVGKRARIAPDLGVRIMSVDETCRPLLAPCGAYAQHFALVLGPVGDGHTLRLVGEQLPSDVRLSVLQYDDKAQQLAPPPCSRHWEAAPGGSSPPPRPCASTWCLVRTSGWPSFRSPRVNGASAGLADRGENHEAHKGHEGFIKEAPRRFEWNSPGNLCQITRKIRNEEPEWTATRYCFLGWV